MGEQHATELERAVAYLNMDAAVSGADFSASAVPSLKEFIRQVARDVPSPAGGTVYSVWRETAGGQSHRLADRCHRIDRSATSRSTAR